MAWFKVDDRLWAHPKWMHLPDSARALWVTAGSYCAQYETDGYINSATIPQLGSRKAAAERLVKAQLWNKVEGGYQFHDWDEFQPTKAQLDAERRATKERVQRWRDRKRNGVTNGESNGVSNGAVTAPRPDPTRPDPLITKEDKSSLVGANAQTTKKRATPIPDAWTPKDGHSKLALEHGVQLLTEASKFRDHAQATGRTLKDWDAGFRNWLRKAGEYRQHNQPSQFGPTAFAGVNPFGGHDDNPF